MASQMKKRCTDPKQRTLFGASGIIGLIDAPNYINTNKNSIIDDSQKDKSVNKVVRNWDEKWMKTYSWLKSEVSDDGRFMYCQVCTDGGRYNAMHKANKNKNFQNSTLSRHAELDDHKILLKVPQLQQNFNKALKHSSARQDFAATVLLKLVHWLTVEDIPFSKYESLLELLLSFSSEELDALQILKKPCENSTKSTDKGIVQYDSSTSCSGLLDSLAVVVENDLNNKLRSSPIVTALADESTDIANNKRLVIYAQIIDKETMRPSTRFLTNVEITDASGKGIGETILREFQNRGVSAEKIMSLGSDGASVMTGKKTGCAAIMRRRNPHMYNVHCVAHRLALCTSQAAENIPTLKQHQQVLTDLFYYFKGSAKRSGRLHEIQSVLDEPVLTIKEIHSVRWLSYFNALTALYRTLESLLTYLAEAKQADPKAIGLRKKIATDSFLTVTYLMMDAMAPITVLSQFFQTENVDVALVKVKLDLCMRDLSSIKTLDTPHLTTLKNDVPEGSSTFKGHTIIRSNLKLDKLASEFADSLIANIKSRFPKDDILTAFSILSMRPITFLGDAAIESYGVEELKTFCDFYGQQQTVTWKEDGEEKEKTSKAIIDPDETAKEWFMLKKVVMAEKYPRDKMSELWWYINKYHHSQFPNLINLACLALTCSVHTAGCERGFSIQNRILTTFRNRLGVEKQRKLMIIKIDGSERQKFRFDEALEHWKSYKDRRLYEINSFK